MNPATEDFPVVNYNPAHYIPMHVFQSQWANFKEEGAERAEDPYGRNPAATAFSAGLNSSAPFVLMMSMMVIVINTMSFRSLDPSTTSVGTYLSNPSLIVALIAFIVSMVTLSRKIKFATTLKNSADFALLESARRYLTQRYETIPENWEDRFISYLVGEEVKENRFSETYELTVRTYKGFKVVMVANINGEAPLKN